jgi:hypothetical protein
MRKGCLVQVAKAFVGALGFDCVAIIDEAMARTAYANGCRFAVRYLGSLSTGERNVILDAGLALMPVTYCRAPGWVPSGTMGYGDGHESVTHLRAAGIPQGVTVWRDLEGPGGSPSNVIEYVNAWCEPVRQAGYDPGLYVGYDCHLTGAQLTELAVDRYWHSLSRVADNLGRTSEPTCGWCMHQLYPTCPSWHGYNVDLNVVQQDYRGRLPYWVVA